MTNRAQSVPRAENPGIRTQRCCCGQLLAVRTPRGIEIKCKRCRRVHLIPIRWSQEARDQGSSGVASPEPSVGEKSG
ncbi:MAG TPA: hypothetical protein DD417_20960 [Elusimicrobia bacterium]|nr:hypothetical protein [Elusimicrobiota bacterium]